MTVYIKADKIPKIYSERIPASIHIGDRYIPWSEPQVLFPYIVNKNWSICKRIEIYFHTLQASLGKNTVSKEGKNFVPEYVIEFKEW